MRSFGIARSGGLVIGAVFAASAALHAGDVSELEGIVYEASGVDQAAAEALFASAEAAAYFPELQRLRWIELKGRTAAPLDLEVSSRLNRNLADFESDLENDFPSFRSIGSVRGF